MQDISRRKVHQRNYYYRHRDKILIKQRERLLRKKEKNRIVLNRFEVVNYEPIKIITETNENKTIIEDEYCEVFGCDEKLSIRQKLFGKRCINHQTYQISVAWNE